MPAALAARRPGAACHVRATWPMNSITSVNAEDHRRDRVGLGGHAALRTWPKMNSGSVDDPGPDTNVVIT